MPLKKLMMSGSLGLLLSVPFTLPCHAAAPAAVPGSNKGRHEEKVAAVKKEKFELLVIGDSIIHTLQGFGGKYAPLDEVWAKHFAPRRALNLGYSSYRVENILWNLQNGELEGQTPKVAILLIGTNNADSQNFAAGMSTPEQISAGTQAIVETIQQKSPDTKILILRIFPKGGKDETGTSEPVFHFSLEEIETARQAGALTEKLADNKRVFWLDINDIFLRPKSKINTRLMPDLLHPNEKGAEAWVKAIEPTLSRLMGDKPIK
ncbi:MAG: GDSL-type esterase/lipase family protein [Verrucomicrobiota bacterium]